MEGIGRGAGRSQMKGSGEERLEALYLATVRAIHSCGSGAILKRVGTATELVRDQC